MSGSGGGGTPIRQTRHEPDCLTLAFETALEHVPNAPEHEPSTTLEILRQRTPEGKRIYAVDNDGIIVGIVTERLATLNRCMDNDIQYIASVISVTMGVYRVAVRARMRG